MFFVKMDSVTVIVVVKLGNMVSQPWKKKTFHERLKESVGGLFAS
jgi:uncharacterized membrane-anchored protein